MTEELEVQSATCKCPRGLEICHHIAATLLAAHYEFSKTDGDCSWASRRNDAPEVHTIDEVFNIKKPPRVTDRNLTQAELRELFEKLKEIPPVGFRWLLRTYFDEDIDGDAVNDAILDSIDVVRVILSPEFDQTDHKTDFLKEKLKLTSSTISQILNITSGQANSVDWFVVRKNRITASNFGKVINSASRNRFPPSLFSSLYGKHLDYKSVSSVFVTSNKIFLLDHRDLRGVRAIQWGTTHEKDGLEFLRKILKKDVTSCGIFLSESGVLGASPDGITDDDYVVEVKCPYKFRKVLLTVALKNDTSYIVHFDDAGKLWINKKHPYYHQIQGQIYLSNRKGCHLDSVLKTI